MIGQRFSRLAVVAAVSGTRAKWVVRCDCGSELVVLGSTLRNGRRTSCGCKHRDARSHGHARSNGRSPTYKTWMVMRRRCGEPSFIVYPKYGGRGIKVCDRWQSFENFIADMGERPVGKTLDRIDSNGNYEPGNCRWATATEQGRNTRRTKLTETLAAEIRASSEATASLARRLGVSWGAVKDVRDGRTWKESK